MNKKDTELTRWPGYIVLPSYLTFPNLSKWQKAIADGKKYEDAEDYTAFYENLLPVALEMVKEWHIDADDLPKHPEKVTVDTFPASTDLTGFIIKCVADLYAETNGSDPNLDAQS